MSALKRKRTNGIERAFQILDCLVELGEPATAYTIAKTKKAPLSTVYNLIESLERLDVLRRHNDEGEYFLGSKLFSLGLAYANSTHEDEVLRRYSRELAQTTGYDAILCIRDGEQLLVSFKADGAERLRVSTKVGARLPLTWTASGLLLLGHLSPEERNEFWLAAPPSPGGQAATDPATLEEKCRAFWDAGYGIQAAESEFDVAYVAAPVISPPGECRVTMCLVVPGKLAAEKGEELAATVKAAARAVESEMGWTRSGGVPLRPFPATARK